MQWIYSCLFILYISVFSLSCQQSEEETTDSPPESPEPPAEISLPPDADDTLPWELEMVIQDEDFDKKDALFGDEKFFVVQQTLSNGQIAVFIADNHHYESWYEGFFSWLGGKTLAEKAQARIKKILLDQGNALKTKVCKEDSVQNRKNKLITEGLTVGTLILINSNNTFTTYMDDLLNGGFFKDYRVSYIDREANGLVIKIILSKYSKQPNIQITENEVTNAPSITNTERFDLSLVTPSSTSKIQKSPINLEQYLNILNDLQGEDGQFSSCNS